MKILKIYCKNCSGTGAIQHPGEMLCPFCDGKGNKDIEYSDDAKSTKSKLDNKSAFAVKVANEINSYLRSCTRNCYCKILPKVNGVSDQERCGNCHAKDSIEELKRNIFKDDANSVPESNKSSVPEKHVQNGCKKPFQKIFTNNSKYPDDYLICGFSKIGDKIMFCDKCKILYAQDTNNEKNPAHYCFGCEKYLGFRGYCSEECHDKCYDVEDTKSTPSTTDLIKRWIIGNGKSHEGNSCCINGGALIDYINELVNDTKEVTEK